MRLYSYKGQEPRLLPNRIRLENGNTVTKLNKVSDEELISYGFSGPFEVPPFNLRTQEISWNGKEYKVTDIPTEILEQRNSEETEKIKKSIDNLHFYNIIKNTLFFKRIRKESGIDLKVAVLYSEIISFIPTFQIVDEIFGYLDKLSYLISFNEEEVQSLQKCLSKFKLSYNVPETTSKYYDFDTDTIVDTTTRPFESWVWNETKWTAPVPYPTDGKFYIWDDTTKKWKKI